MSKILSPASKEAAEKPEIADAIKKSSGAMTATLNALQNLKGQIAEETDASQKIFLENILESLKSDLIKLASN